MLLTLLGGAHLAEAARAGSQPNAVTLGIELNDEQGDAALEPEGPAPPDPPDRSTDIAPSPSERAPLEPSAAALAAVVAAPRGLVREDPMGLMRARQHERRPAPNLEGDADGGYSWRSPGFIARISPEGELSFEEVPWFGPEALLIGPWWIGRGGIRSLQLAGPQHNPRDAGRDAHMPNRVDTIGFAFISLIFRFDITTLFERLRGNDPYYAERAWFTDETEALREELEDRSRSIVDRHERQHLRERLMAIDSDPDIAPSERRRIVFELWEDCAEDEIGRRARTTIMGFIRDRWPEGSEFAYTEEELQRLNRRRASLDQFSP